VAYSSEANLLCLARLRTLECVDEAYLFLGSSICFAVLPTVSLGFLALLLSLGKRNGIGGIANYLEDVESLSIKKKELLLTTGKRL
jgi:hypothetical protein